MTATQVLVVAKAQMSRVLRTQPGFADRFIAHLLAHNIRLEANLTDLLLYSSEQRLAHLLFVLANCDERRPRRCALPHLPQEILAEMVGTTRSRVNSFIGNPTGLRLVHDGDRLISIAASAASPQARESEERHWPLAG